MSHSQKRKNSCIRHFRMDVPKDIRHLVGKTSWQHSLGTTDLHLADARNAHYLAHYKQEVIRLRATAASNLEARAEAVVEKAFDGLAASYGSMDKAVATELDSLALTVRGSWSQEDARQAEREILGEEISPDWMADDGAIDVFDERGRQNFILRAGIFESRKETYGLVYQELARSLLERGLHDPLQYQVACMAYGSDDLNITSRPAFEAIARAYLKRLAQHEFSSWPDNLREALAPVVQSSSNEHSTGSASDTLTTPIIKVAGGTLDTAFHLWRARKGYRPGERHKTADEFATAIRRFELLIGTSEVAEITTDMVKKFRKLVAQLPFRPGKELKALTLHEQIAEAHRLKLPTLAPPTVGKHIAGLKAVLGEAVEAKWIPTNPAASVIVEGARWEGTERDHFNDADMQLIYTSPLMTDPNSCSDTMFWILFLAPFHGSRPGEHCKLKPGEIVYDGDQWQMRFRADRRPRKVDLDAPVTRPRRQKTPGSIRDVPIHWIVEEGGFLEFASIQRARGVEWLFDELTADMYGDRYKYLSREINAALRELGITDPDKSFYSTRHTMKREGRRRGVVKSSLDQMTGHASDTGDKYGQRMPADVLKVDVDRLEFRSVPWDAVVRAGKNRVTRMAERYGIAL